MWVTFQSAIKINQFQSLVIFHQNTKTIALVFGQKSLMLDHFSIYNQNQSISNFVISHQITKAIALLFSPKIADLDHFSICLQNQSISKLVIFHQNTKTIALLFGQKSLMWVTFQSAIKINQFQIWSFFTKIPRL